MPTLVHIANEKDASRIRRSGIIPGTPRGVVYFMPVVQDHFISHQWLRELKRSGARVLVGVYFRLPDDELVWAGKYDSSHAQMSLGSAFRDLTAQSDPLGYELFVSRKVLASEITRIRHLPQNIGWRYMPHAHGRALCGCPACLPRGSIRSRGLRERIEPVQTTPSLRSVQTKIMAGNDPDTLLDCLWPLRTKRRRSDPAFLERLLLIQDDYLHQELASTLAYFRHPNSKRLLLKLSESQSVDVQESAAESLIKLYQHDADAMLKALSANPLVSAVLERGVNAK